MGSDGAFPLLGEPLAVDLVNTRVAGEGPHTDLLDTPQALESWLAAQAPRVAWAGVVRPADLAAVRQLRDGVAALVEARREGHAANPAAIGTVNRAVAGAPAHRVLSWPPGQPPRAAAVRRGTPIAGLLATVAESAVTLLAGPDAERLRTCEHPDCVLVFVAANSRRRWCSAARCGNRARVARHYHRHRAAR